MPAGKKAGKAPPPKKKKVKIPDRIKVMLPGLSGDINRTIGALETIEGSGSTAKLIETLGKADEMLRAYLEHHQK